MIQGRSVSNFNDYTYDLVTGFESAVPNVYFDTVANIPTVGVGYALLTFDGSTWSRRSSLESDFSGIHVFSQGELQLLDSIAADLNNGDPASAQSLFANRANNLLSFTLSESQMRELFQISLEEVLDEVDRVKGGIDDIQTDLAGTHELAAIYSLAFNSPSLIGDSLLAALRGDDRQAAWYEILYGSNAGRLHGLQNRREAEADEFGLFSQGDHPAIDDNGAEAKAVLRFHDLHRQEMLDYLNSLDVPPADPKQEVEEDFNPARETLKQLFGLGRTYNDVIVDPKDHEGSLQLPTPNEGSYLIFGEDGADRITLDTGNNTAYGGEGKDVFISGAGTNIVDGGEGADKFAVGANGSVTVIADADANDRIGFQVSLIDAAANASAAESYFESLQLDPNGGSLSFGELPVPGGAQNLAFDQSYWTKNPNGLGIVNDEYITSLDSGSGLSSSASVSKYLPVLGGFLTKFSESEDDSIYLSTATTWSVDELMTYGYDAPAFTGMVHPSGESYFDDYAISVTGSPYYEPLQNLLGTPSSYTSYYDISYYYYNEESDAELFANELGVPGLTGDDLVVQIGYNVGSDGYDIDTSYVIIKDFDQGDCGIKLFDSSPISQSTLDSSPESGHLDYYGDDFGEPISANPHAAEQVAYINNNGEYLTISDPDNPPDNDAPSASDDSAPDAPEASPQLIAASSLTANDSDADGDPLMIASVSNAVGGVAVLTLAGDVVFAPTNGFTGTAGYDYTVSDGVGGTDTAHVTLTITADPTPIGITVNGTSGDDSLGATADRDTMYGGAGDDGLFGGAGNDVLYGEDGNDSLDGEDGDNLLIGGAGDDWMIAEGGNDRFDGGDGFDAVDFSGFSTGGFYDLLGGSYQIGSVVGTMTAVEWLNLAGGDDVVRGDANYNSVYAGAGNDQVYAGDGDDDINGADGNDTLYGEGGADILQGGIGDDTIDGGAGSDTWLFGGDGADYIDGGDGDDEISGGVGDDQLYGGAGADSVVGDAGNDIINGGGGDDTWLAGGDGDDLIRGGSGSDEMSGGGGADQLYGDAGADDLNGGAGNDSLYGGLDNDTLNGDADDDLLDGGAGDDFLNGGTGSDQLLGGTGIDELTGGDGDDTLSGGDGDDDWIDGSAGNDTLAGNAGDDALNGGAGDDTYLFGRGDGFDIVFNSDTTSTSDEVLFGTGIATDQLWFMQQGDDLNVSIVGTQDSVTIKDWYTDPGVTVNFETSDDGSTLAKASVQQLVDAMAQFDAPSGTDTDLPPSYQQALEPTIAAAWQSS